MRRVILALSVGVVLLVSAALPGTANAASPEVAVIQPIRDAKWLEGCCSSHPAVTDGTLVAGVGAYEDWLAALQFDLSSVPPTAGIISADLRMYFTGECLNAYFHCGDWPQTFYAFRATQPWTYSSVEDVDPTKDGVISDGVVEGEKQFDVYPPPRWMTIELDELVLKWVNGSAPNYGVIVDGWSAGYGGGGYFYSSRHSDPALRPVLVVSYVPTEDELHNTVTDTGGNPYDDTPMGDEMVDGSSEYLPDFQGEDANVESPATIIGPDDRVRITGDRIRKFPYRAIVHIERSNGTDCSGMMIDRRTVATAGHCIWDRDLDQWRGIDYVAPGQDGATTRPYGACGVIRRFVTDGYKKYGAVGADYGALRLDCNVGNDTGWFGLIRNPDDVVRGITSIISGYAADKPEGTQWRSIDQIRRVFRFRLFYRNDTVAGMSGAPVFRGRDAGCRWCAVAIHTRGGEALNSGSRIGRQAFRNYSRWRTAS